MPVLMDAEIGEEIRHHGLRNLAEGTPGAEDRIVLTVMNPLPFPRTECVSADLYFHTNWKQRYSEPFGY